MVNLTGSILPTLKEIKHLPSSLFQTALARQVSEARLLRTHHWLAGVTTADSREISVPKDEIADNLGRLGRRHRQLCDFVDMVAACYGLLLFIRITYSFASSVFGIYEIITELNKPVPFIRLRPFIGCVTCACRLILISVQSTF
jgi:hypothetical protein